MNPLTELSPEEAMFQTAIFNFARERVAPHVSSMDERAALEPALVAALFELGVMGIEIPERFGGSGSSFFNAILGVEALARVDASLAVLVDVQNTLVINALLRWATSGSSKLISQGWPQIGLVLTR